MRYVFGAVIALASWPYALYVMGPVNNQILALTARDVGAARALVRQWGLLELASPPSPSLPAVAMFLWIL